MTSILESQDTVELLDAAKERGVFNSSYLLLSQIDPLLKKLKLADAGRLSGLASHNHARLVTDKKGNHMVLKLISQNTSLETECLREWARNDNTVGLVPKLFDYGDFTNGGKWNLQEFLMNVKDVKESRPSFSHKRKDFEMIGESHFEEALQLAKRICSNDFNRNIFPDEVDVLSLSLEREFDSGGKQIKALAKALLESRDYLTQERMFLVHGDFHAGNIFFTEQGAKVIDPFGMKGTKASDAAKYIALSMRSDNIKEYALKAEEITDCNRIDLGWLIAANLVNRLHYLRLMGKPSRNEKGHVELAYKAIEIW